MALRTRDGRLRAWAVLLVLVAMVPAVAGCYGRFPLTRAVYNFNKQVSEDEVVQSVAMWAMVIIPVYGVAVLGDAVVIHLIEFWSGDPVDVGSRTLGDGTETALTPSADGREMVLAVSRDGRELSRTTFVRVSDGAFEVRDAEGRLAGTVRRTSSGALELTDAHGAVIRTLAAADVAAVRGS